MFKILLIIVILSALALMSQDTYAKKENFGTDFFHHTYQSFDKAYHTFSDLIHKYIHEPNTYWFQKDVDVLDTAEKAHHAEYQIV